MRLAWGVGLALVGTACFSSCGHAVRNPNKEALGREGCVTALAAAGERHCAVRQDGTVWCWGSSHVFGPSNFPDSPFPEQVERLKGARELVMGPQHACALLETGEVWCWGNNSAGQISHDSKTPVSPMRVTLGSAMGVKGLSLGFSQTCVLDQLSHVFCWGTDASGQRADAPTQVMAPGPPEAELAAGTPLLFDERGQVYDLDVWSNPQLEREYGPNNAWVKQLAEPRCRLTRSGSLWCKDFEQPYWRVEDRLGENVRQADMGEGFRCALLEDGRVWCAGKNDLGQLGIGSTQATDAGFVSGLGVVISLALADHSACALEENGSVSCWGSYAADQQSNAPERVTTCEQMPSLMPSRAPTKPAPDLGARLDEAGRARGQSLCECGAPLGTDVDECAEAETFLADGSCAMALAPDDVARFECLARVLWLEADCFANPSCRHSFDVPATLGSSCAPQEACPEAKHPKVEGFCRGFVCSKTASGPLGKQRLCDGIADCPDGSDELNCTPNAGFFNCTDGSKAQTDELCDGKTNCPDASDELHCF